MQLPVQFVNAVVSTPSLSDEVQVEVMKVLSLPSLTTKSVRLSHIVFFCRCFSLLPAQNHVKSTGSTWSRLLRYHAIVIICHPVLRSFVPFLPHVIIYSTWSYVPFDYLLDNIIFFSIQFFNLVLWYLVILFDHLFHFFYAIIRSTPAYFIRSFVPCNKIIR